MDREQEVTERLLVKKHRADLSGYKCSVIAALKVFATKWKPCILCYLSGQSMRYNELYRIIPNISRKMLSAHLRELEKDQLVLRKEYDRKKQRVEYSLTARGRSLMTILEEIQDWGMNNIDGVLSIKDMLAVNHPSSFE